MEYRKLGAGDLTVSAVVFGAWAIGGWMWGGTNIQESMLAIRAALDQGITTFDTAPAYGQGLSEELLGKALKGVPRHRIQILTKFGLRWDSTEGTFYFQSEDAQGRALAIHKFSGYRSVLAECEASLRRLGTDYIDLYQIHWPDPLTPVEETMEALLRLQEQGKIRHAGVCNYPVKLLDRADACMPVLSDQVPYSMLLRDIEQDLVPYCLEHEKGILAYSPLQRGILSGKFRPGHHFAAGDHRADSKFYQQAAVERIDAFLDRLRPLAAAKEVSLSQLVIRWTLQQPGITAALVGARNASQAVENAKATRVLMNGEDLQVVEEALDTLELPV